MGRPKWDLALPVNLILNPFNVSCLSCRCSFSVNFPYFYYQVCLSLWVLGELLNLIWELLYLILHWESQFLWVNNLLRVWFTCPKQKNVLDLFRVFISTLKFSFLIQDLCAPVSTNSSGLLGSPVWKLVYLLYSLLLRVVTFLWPLWTSAVVLLVPACTPVYRVEVPSVLFIWGSTIFLLE